MSALIYDIEVYILYHDDINNVQGEKIIRHRWSSLLTLSTLCLSNLLSGKQRRGEKGSGVSSILVQM